MDPERINGKLSVPRRVQASMVSLNLYCTLAEAYALLAWWATPGAGKVGDGGRGARTKEEIGTVSENVNSGD